MQKGLTKMLFQFSNLKDTLPQNVKIICSTDIHFKTGSLLFIVMKEIYFGESFLELALSLLIILIQFITLKDKCRMQL